VKSPATLRIEIGPEPLKLETVRAFAYRSAGTPVEISIAPEFLARARASETRMREFIDQGLPIYGVTTGFGDSCHRVISPSQTEELQKNLVSYLLVGTGPTLPREATRATFLIRLRSLARGYSGVSEALLERMKLYLERDWIPVVPREGSLGASGDLIPLAYIAEVLRGEGRIHAPVGASGDRSVGGRSIDDVPSLAMKEVLAAERLDTYRLKPKEGLALTNGTSAMAGLALTNLASARAIVETAMTSTAWMVLALGGRTEAFEPLVNEIANTHSGQARVARRIRELLRDENYASKPLTELAIRNSETDGFVQDRYSVRCTPQVLGPVLETVELAERWLETELNGTADNPLVGEDGALAMGGNFYGGYLSQAMDYLKISLAHVADLVDRQLTLLIDDKSNRGLPANLADWKGLPENERHLHHGLKALHQAANALTSETMARAMPGGIFSRSSESHNQDKVSLGMSAAVQCAELIDPLFRLQTLALVCFAQAIDLRERKLAGAASRDLYATIRETIPFVKRDTSLGRQVEALTEKLKLANRSKPADRNGL
jgi:histidine ammonia-lyase/phenylalanine ammonia-lyase